VAAPGLSYDTSTMDDVESLGQTAFLISELRAEEARQEPKLFDDPFAQHFSSLVSKAALRRAQGFGPLFSAGLRVRVRWFDDVLQRELQRGTRQVLILGAGMDCRALRFPRPGTTYFEVDTPDVLAFKAQRLASAGLQGGAVAVGADYMAPGLFDRLASHGFDRTLSTLVLWEGNIYYLPPDAARRLLRQLAESIADLRLAFDYCGSAVIEGRSQVPGLNQVGKMVAQMGAPWLCAIDDVAEVAREANLQVMENVSAGELLAAWLPGLDLDLGAGASGPAEIGVCLLTHQPPPAAP